MLWKGGCTALHLQAAMRSAAVFAAVVVALGESSCSMSSNPFLISARTEMRTPWHARNMLLMFLLSPASEPLLIATYLGVL